MSQRHMTHYDLYVRGKASASVGKAHVKVMLEDLRAIAELGLVETTSQPVLPVAI